MKLSKSICAFALLLFAMNTFAQSQGSGSFENFHKPIRVYVGGFYPTMTTDISVNGSQVTPPSIVIEDVLGVDDSKFVPYGGIKWHISQKHSLEMEYFQLNRDGFTDLISDPVEVADLIIESGNVATEFDTSVTRLTYGYSLKRTDRMDLQLKAGLHVANFSLGLQLNGNVCDTTLGEMPPGCPAGQSPAAETEDVTAPLPHFGASWAYAMTPTMAAEIRAIGFAIEIDNIDGGLLEVSGDIVWKPNQKFGVGAGLRFFRSNVSGTGTKLNAEIEVDYFGPTVFVMASF